MTQASAAQAPTRARFLVLLFGVLLAGVTYLDRVCISITAQPIMKDLGLNEFQMSFVFSAFALSYAIFEIPTGYWGDRIGARRVLTRIVIWWSSFTMITAAAFSYPSLLAARFLFGMGEAGAWPNAARAFSRWFPLTERGTAQGIFFMGAHFAGGVTPLLVGAMLTVMPWRFVFLIFGLTGFVWAFAWFRWFRDDPSEHPSVNQAELAHICRGRLVESRHAITWKQFTSLGANRNVVLLSIMYFTQSYGFYFYITWLPTYLARVRGLKAAQLGLAAGLPLLISVLADLSGGLTTDWAVRRVGLRWGRAAVGVCSFVCASAFLIAGTVAADAATAALLIALAAACSNFPLGACWGTCLDIGGSQAGVVSACMNTAGQVGSLLSPLILGYVVANFASWTAPLFLTGALYSVGALCWLFINAERPIWSAEPTS